MPPDNNIRTRAWRGWTLHEADTLGSTNDHARDLPPWHAIRAKRQTGARGRHGRKWESGEGGLWISAVLPLEPPDAAWNAFPLAAGLAVVSLLRGLGLPGARLRWPNDVLIGSKKICGILMEKFASDRVVVGIGLNVSNNPAADDASLAAVATWLGSELPLAPPVEELYEDLLIALRILHARIAEEGLAPLAEEINAHWGGTREVELTTAAGPLRGHFLGINGRGDLLVRSPEGIGTHTAAHVQLMREI
jgi:BirA family biotin operon repressor/biotin-[acetyl-CoA-carboxylase] ligase